MILQTPASMHFNGCISNKTLLELIVINEYEN